MPNIWSLNGFLSYIVEEGEILDMLYCTGIDTFCLTLFRGFQAVQDDTGGVDTGILNSQETTGFLLFWCGVIFVHMNALCIEVGPGLLDCRPA